MRRRRHAPALLLTLLCFAGTAAAVAAGGGHGHVDDSSDDDDLAGLSALLDEYRQLRWAHDQRHTQQQQAGSCPIKEEEEPSNKLEELEARITIHQRRPGVGAFAAELTARVQAAIAARQGDCRRRLMCALAKPCGFGCQVHHAVHCLAAALATGRSLVLEVQGWEYSNDYEAYFRPVGHCAPMALNPFTQAGQPFAARARRRHVALDIIERESGLGTAPPAMPPDVYAEAARFHPRPEVWWVGQLARYILTPAQGATWWEEGPPQPLPREGYAGVHVRRTDKVSTGEAAAFELEKYLERLPAGPGSVYLATDEPALLAAAAQMQQQQQPGRAVHGRVEAAKVAAGVNSTRYSDASLRGLLRDLAALAQADFFVGTFSSHIGRLAHELAQTLRADAAFAARSLDARWYYGGQQPAVRCLMAAHGGLLAGHSIVVDDRSFATAAFGFVRDVVAGVDVPVELTRPCAPGYLPLFAPLLKWEEETEQGSDDEDREEEEGEEESDEGDDDIISCGSR